MKIGQTWLLKMASVRHDGKRKTHWPWPPSSQIQASQRCWKHSACQAKSHSLSLVGLRFSAFCIKMTMMGSSNERSTDALNSTARMLWSAVWTENVVHHQAQKIIRSEKKKKHPAARLPIDRFILAFSGQLATALLCKANELLPLINASCSWEGRQLDAAASRLIYSDVSDGRDWLWITPLPRRDATNADATCQKCAKENPSCKWRNPYKPSAYQWATN